MADKGEWREARAAHNRIYYWNTRTRETTWEKPSSLQARTGAIDTTIEGKRNKQDTDPKPKNDQGEEREEPIVPSQQPASRKRSKVDKPANPEKQGSQEEDQEEDRKTTVKMKLQTFIKHDFRDIMKKALETIVLNANVAIHQGYLIMNLHVIRCLEEDLPLPNISQSFCYRCLTQNAGPDSILAETIRQCHELRPEGAGLDNPLKNLSSIAGQVAKEMLTATKNHIVLNFRPRLEKYVRRKYGLSSSKEASQFVTTMFLQGWTDAHLVDAQRETKAWLGNVNPLELEDYIMRTVTPDDLKPLLRLLRDMARL